MKCRNHVNPKSSWHQQRQIDSSFEGIIHKPKSRHGTNIQYHEDFVLKTL